MTGIKRPTLPLTGGCPCGLIRYEITAMPLALYACHCTDCQRKSGSAFALNMPLPAGAFRIVQGSPKGWSSTGPSGEVTTAWFCRDCSGRLYGERPSRPETITLRAGTLDDTSWLVPAVHIFMRSAQAWDGSLRPAMAENVPCYDTMPEDFTPLVKAWREKIGEA
jgi:hypothetical protein